MLSNGRVTAVAKIEAINKALKYYKRGKIENGIYTGLLASVSPKQLNMASL